MSLALPVLLGSLSLNALNLIDTAMVGTLGSAALAATGIGMFANLMLVNALTGISTAVQAMTARRLGGRLETVTCLPLNGGLLLVCCVALPLSLVAYQLVPVVFPLLNGDNAVFIEGMPYLQTLVVALLPAGCNAALRGFWNGLGRTTVTMAVLMLMVVVNILLNYAFIFGNWGAPAMGTTGAGFASLLAACSGTLAYVLLVLILRPGQGFLRRLPEAAALATLLRLAVPAGVRGVFLIAGYLAFFWLAGLAGTEILAVSNVLFRIFVFVLLPALAIGTAAATLVGQSLGRKEPEQAARWGWLAARFGMIILLLPALPMIFLPDLLLGIFLHDPALLATARLPLQLLGLTACLAGLEPIFRLALLGAGESKRIMVWTVLLQWGLFLPAVWLAVQQSSGLLALWLLQIAWSLLSVVVYALLWRAGKWQSIRV